MSNLTFVIPEGAGQLQNANPPTDQRVLKIDTVTGKISLVDSLGAEIVVGAAGGNSSVLALVHEFTLAEINAWVGLTVNIDFALARPAGTILKAIYVLAEEAIVNPIIPGQSVNVLAAIKCFGFSVTANEFINGAALQTLNKVSMMGTTFAGGNDALVGPDNLRVIVAGELAGAPSALVGAQFTFGKFKVFAEWATTPTATYLGTL